MRSHAEKISFCAILIAFGMILSYVEAIVPINLVIPFPGFKLGLANISVMLAFFVLGIRYAVAVSVCRISLCALLFGSATSFFFSLCGGILSLIAMLAYSLILKRFNGVLGLSVLCAAMHDLGQCIACSILFGHYVITFYLPYLLMFSIITGSITGLLVYKFTKLNFLAKGTFCK